MTRSVSNFDPSIAHLWLNGKPLAEWLSNAQNFQAQLDSVSYDEGNTKFVLSVDPSLNIWKIEQFRGGGKASETVIQSWQKLKTGGLIPSVVMRENFNRDSSRLNKTTYELKSISYKVPEEALAIKWRERTLVEDFINGKHLKFLNGKLIVNHQFDDPNPSGPLVKFGIISSVVLIALGFFIARRGRSRKT